ncbi:aldehyde ferredoxin oxidoreductase, partial [bacterium]
RLMDAADLWGQDALETERVLHERHDDQRDVAVACIGPAGERRSLIAGICHDNGRMAARSGLGALMGSKRLKALVLKRGRPVGSADTLRMKQLTDRVRRYYTLEVPLPPGSWMPALGRLLRRLPLTVRMDGLLVTLLYQKWGTSSLNQTSVEWGDSPVKNWQGSYLDYPARISNGIDPDKIRARELRKYHCYACPLGCGGICTLDGKGVETHKPEYETIMSFGGMLLNGDLESIFAINDRLNRAGMDSISAGATIAYAMELFEQGRLTLADTGGLELRWGNAAAVSALLEQMIAREGLGDLLADGTRAAARRLNGSSAQGAVNAGGQEISMHDPRLDPGYALHASVEPTPGRHTTGALIYYDMYRLWTRVKSLPHPLPLYSTAGRYRPNGRNTAAAVANSCYTQLYNAAGLCMFGAFLGADRLPIFEWLNAALGWQKSPLEYLRIGKRIQTLRQMFNLREGIDPREMKINPRAAGQPPQRQGANRGRSVPVEESMRAYWRAIGWGEDGRPTPEMLRELGLEEYCWNSQKIEDD